tara:strand:- start:3491 stop:4048 length:558 start_codon:yes stop_codon:yes gene_type:complete
MYKILLIFFLLNLYNTAFSSPKEKIISRMELINNMSFNFVQTIGDKREIGKCTIKYPKKLYCEYDNIKKKIIVSNGKSLVVNNRTNGSYYVYPLKKTALEFLLNKDFLISKIFSLKPILIEDKYLNFKIFENDIEINIFFDQKNFDLIGWQTEDVYQNLIITFISSVKINQKINEKNFILPESKR